MIAQRVCKEKRKEGAKPGSNYSDGDLHSLKAKIPNHREGGREMAQSICMCTKFTHKF